MNPGLTETRHQGPDDPARHALDAQNAIPGCRVELFDGAGHFPHLEDPDRFTRVLRDLIAAEATQSRSQGAASPSLS
jgi:pimeloyl-ACP methyl ester carboxylesterase